MVKKFSAGNNSKGNNIPPNPPNPPPPFTYF
jgi:hypothetical protein